jgi:hypothetical protein
MLIIEYIYIDIIKILKKFLKFKTGVLNKTLVAKQYLNFLVNNVDELNQTYNRIRYKYNRFIVF